MAELEVYGRRGRQSIVLRFMEARGQMFERGILPPRRGGWHRTAKACFRNAFLNADTDPVRYRYCEGFYLSRFGWFPHAWFIDRQQPNLALDATSRQDEKYEYFGMPIAWKYVRAALMAEGAFGSVLEYLEKTKREAEEAGKG